MQHREMPMPPVRPAARAHGAGWFGSTPAHARIDRTLWAGILFVACVAAIATFAGSLAWAVYALAFWHYLLYLLAYRFGAVAPQVFRRDAVFMKSVSLLGLGAVYLAAPVDGLSLVVVAAGFALNACAASVLGAERTYYGHELAGLEPLRVVRFPYSVIAHPMLVGNMLAFGGTLLNAEFRAAWWPLACAHVAANLGLLLMERHVLPLRLAANPLQRPPRFAGWRSGIASSATGAVLAAVVAAPSGWPPSAWAAVLGAAAALFAHTLYGAYTLPRAAVGARPHPQLENAPCAPPPS